MGKDDAYYAQYEKVTDNVAKFALSTDQGVVGSARIEEQDVPKEAEPGDFVRVNVEDGEIVDINFDSELNDKLQEQIGEKAKERHQKAQKIAEQQEEQSSKGGWSNGGTE